jgi:predicted  nucleic acid-binding Zn-ribbon protein
VSDPEHGGRGDNPRLRQEATEAQEAEDTLRRRLVEMTQRLVELKESQSPWRSRLSKHQRYWKVLEKNMTVGDFGEL